MSVVCETHLKPLQIKDSSVICPNSSLINACPGHKASPPPTKMAQLLIPAQHQHHAVCRLQLSVACLLVFSILQTLQRRPLQWQGCWWKGPLPTKTRLFHSSAFIIVLYSTLYLYLSLCANIWFTKYSAGYLLPAFTIGMFGWLRLPINRRKCIAWSRLELVS